MKRSRRLSTLAFLFALHPCLQAQTVNSVVNGATFEGNVAPGSLATIFGVNLSKDAPLHGSTLPLPITLGDVQVSVNGHAAPLNYVDSTQINFQVPLEVTPGPASVVVTASGAASPSFAFSVVKAAPGIFTASTQAAAQNQDGATNDSGHPAAFGSVVVVYLTGQGPVDNPIATRKCPTFNAALQGDAAFLGDHRRPECSDSIPGPESGLCRSRAGEYSSACVVERQLSNRDYRGRCGQ